MNDTPEMKEFEEKINKYSSLLSGEPADGGLNVEETKELIVELLNYQREYFKSKIENMKYPIEDNMLMIPEGVYNQALSNLSKLLDQP